MANLSPRHRLLSAILVFFILLSMGTVVFHYLEGWRWIDSFYFTGVSMLTIGYGDLFPTQDLSKILVVILGFFAIGIAFYSISLIGDTLNQSFREYLYSRLGGTKIPPTQIDINYREESSSKNNL